jgi:plastocyanin
MWMRERGAAGTSAAGPAARWACAMLAWSAASCASFAPELGPLQGPFVDAASDASDARAGGADAAGDLDADATTQDAQPPLDAGPQTWTVLVAPNGEHAFSPQTLTVRAGDTVHWVWQGSGHTVTSGASGTADGAFCSPGDTGCATAPTSQTGATYDHVFAVGGDYPFFCRIHFASGMTGTIAVQ